MPGRFDERSSTHRAALSVSWHSDWHSTGRYGTGFRWYLLERGPGVSW